MKYCWSREIYRSGQEQFSSAQRAQRKFRMEPGRSAAKLARSKKILQYKLSLALKQLRHFYGTRCSFAKIAIPYTIYPSLN